MILVGWRWKVVARFIPQKPARHQESLSTHFTNANITNNSESIHLELFNTELNFFWQYKAQLFTNVGTVDLMGKIPFQNVIHHLFYVVFLKNICPPWITSIYRGLASVFHFGNLWCIFVRAWRREAQLTISIFSEVSFLHFFFTTSTKILGRNKICRRRQFDSILKEYCTWILLTTVFSKLRLREWTREIGKFAFRKLFYLFVCWQHEIQYPFTEDNIRLGTTAICQKSSCFYVLCNMATNNSLYFYSWLRKKSLALLCK